MIEPNAAAGVGIGSLLVGSATVAMFGAARGVLRVFWRRRGGVVGSGEPEFGTAASWFFIGSFALFPLLGGIWFLLLSVYGFND
jgi:hypothetical protein